MSENQKLKKWTIFPLTLEEQEKSRKNIEKLYNTMAQDKECSTCSHCIHVRAYPDFVMGEECECEVGLQCDTVLFSIKNCPSYEKSKLLL